MKVIIVEDSRLARQTLKELLENFPHLSLIGEAENSIEAVNIIKQERPDLILLDVDMPGKNGFELLNMLEYHPKIIFVTAYPDYAVQSFEYNTIDYLLKPVSSERFSRAIERLNQSNSISVDHTKETHAKQSSNLSLLAMDNRTLLRDGERCYFVQLKQIRYFESLGNYTKVFWEQESALILRAIGKIHERLPSEFFFRASRKHLVNLMDVVGVEPWINGGYLLQLKCSTKIEVSRRNAAEFKDIFSL